MLCWVPIGAYRKRSFLQIKLHWRLKPSVSRRMTTFIYVWINLLRFLAVTSKKSFPLVALESPTRPQSFSYKNARRARGKGKAFSLPISPSAPTSPRAAHCMKEDLGRVSYREWPNWLMLHSSDCNCIGNVRVLNGYSVKRESSPWYKFCVKSYCYFTWLNPSHEKWRFTAIH